MNHYSINMRINEEVLTLCCTRDCPRFSAGTCPYSLHEKSNCPLVKEKFAELGKCCATCANLRKERPYEQQEWYVCSKEENGPCTVEGLKNRIIVQDIYKTIDCITWAIEND